MKSIKELLIQYWCGSDTIVNGQKKGQSLDIQSLDIDRVNARRVIMALRGLNSNDYCSNEYLTLYRWFKNWK